MSYRNGHVNGTYGSNRYEDNGQDDASVGASHQRRAGGYGGFYDGALSVPAEPEPQPPQLPQPLFRRRGTDDSAGGFGHFASGRRDTDDYDSSRSRDRSARGQETSRLHGNGTGGKQIEGVLDHINKNWEVMTKEDCVPVHVALQLMDYSSLGRGNDYQDFQRSNRYLQKALKAIVNEHHQGFNSSIGTFHKIQSSIQMSQNRVRTLRNSVQSAKSNLMVTKPELKGLGATSQKYEDMLQILGQIEKLQQVPEQLDARISDKHFLPAVDLLQDALRMIRRSEMENIGALTDLRVYFSNQETSMTDILIEELHDHLYLKSPYCQNRWKPYSGNSTKVSPSENAAVSLPNTWGRPLYRFLDGLDTTLPMEDDASKNPETDSFQYIHMVIEALNKLGHLDVAVDRMEQRLPIELFAIVDRTNKEVELRHPVYTSGAKNLERNPLDVGFENSDGRNSVLTDLLWTLYSKFEGIAEGHRALHDVVAGIVKREGLRHPEGLTRGFKEMWKLFQSEMRSLLHDYLATDGNESYRHGRQPATEANIFHKGPREKNKRVFKLSEVDQKSADIAADQRDLDQILQASVPGLVSKSQRRSGISHGHMNNAIDGPVVGHKLLVEPNVFNISSLLPPSLSFLQRLKDIVPQDSDIAMSTLTSFLDEFIVNVFHPQLEDTVTELCTRSFVEMEAFQKETQWSQHSTKPIFKGTLSFISLIKSFCQLLETLPPDLTSTQLIITQILAYYDKCCEWYKALVRRPQMQAQEEVRLKTAAAMADSGEVRELVEKLWNSDQAEEREDLLQKEVKLLIARTNETPLEPFDIISDRRSVTALCLIYSSMQWLASHLQQLRLLIPEKISSNRTSQKAQHTRHWSLLDTSPSPHPSKNLPIHLPMTAETIAAFDTILAFIRSLATTALLTLQLDIRLGTIHMLTRTLTSPYLLGQAAQDPDPSILSLNTDLLSFSDTLSTHLPSAAQSFITTGLAHLIDTFLVTNASHIQHGMNAPGCGRMQLNILVLSQNLKSIEPASHAHSIELERSARFFDLFAEGADSIVERARDRGGEGLEGFSLEELRVLVELSYKEGVESGVREVQVRNKRELGDRVLVLSECLWNR